MELEGVPVGVAELAPLAFGNFGHFTTMRVVDGRVRGLSLHLERLAADCRRLFDHDLDTARVRELIRGAELPASVLVRVTVFVPEFDLTRPGVGTPRVLISTRPSADHTLAPLRLGWVAYQRDLAEVKHVGLFGPLLHRARVQRSGADDVVFVDATAAVSEGATWNIGFVDGADRLVWPVAACLDGVTRRLLDDAWRGAGRRSVHRRVDLAEVGQLRAAFVTNAAVGVRPVTMIDSAVYPVDHPVCAELAALYDALPTERI